MGARAHAPQNDAMREQDISWRGRTRGDDGPDELSLLLLESLPLCGNRSALGRDLLALPARGDPGEIVAGNKAQRTHILLVRNNLCLAVARAAKPGWQR